MRLLRTDNLLFEEFEGSAIPEYAILSHTWGEGEVSYKDMVSRREISKQKPGYKKIEQCCRQAASMGHQYAWVDTCCIDKRSSAELTEAINAMYKWYGASSICFAYLADVPSTHDRETLFVHLKTSRWFTRGWTLQELIAPKDLLFFDQNWKMTGKRLELEAILVEITKIPSTVIKGEAVPNEFSIAQRMSWAAKRKTTRVEDMAYCLLGLFEVHMPMIYGEGKNAFERLQLEIIRKFHEPSVFAWTRKDIDGSVLARHPLDFEHSAEFDSSNVLDHDRDGPYIMTHLGLSVKAILRPCLKNHGEYQVAYLGCFVNHNVNRQVGIIVDGGPKYYFRILCDELHYTEEYLDPKEAQDIYID